MASPTKEKDGRHLAVPSAQEAPKVLDTIAQQRAADIKAIFDQLDQERTGRVEIETLHDLFTEHLGMDIRREDIKHSLAALLQKRSNSSWFDLEDFRRVMADRNGILYRALTGDVAVPNFVPFCTLLVNSFTSVADTVNEGKTCDYIPELQNVDPNLFAVAVTTVDGQQFAFGNVEHTFPLQGAVSPLLYLAALENVGHAKIHEKIGREPSEKQFNEVHLNRANKPHNPLINTGAIVVCSMLHPELEMSERFDSLMTTVRRIAGVKKAASIGFNQSVYLSEKETGDQNYALAYFMKSQGVFGDVSEEYVNRVLDLYFQANAIEMNVQTLANIASTLAAGGESPITMERVLQLSNVKVCLSSLYTSGMYSVSGEWAYSVGIPAKTGVSGCMMAVIPNVMGIAVFSPLLDRFGSPVRALALIRKLASELRLGVFERIAGQESSKLDPSSKLTLAAQVPLSPLAQPMKSPRKTNTDR